MSQAAAVFNDSISLEDASAFILAQLEPLREHVQVPLLNAVNRVAFEDVAASMTQPPFDRSTVDGYAVSHRELAGASAKRPVKFRLTQQICAGDKAGRALGPGEAALVMTGAMLPPGADCVMWQEDAIAGDGVVLIPRQLQQYRNCRRRGSELAPGQVLVRRGDVLGAVQLSRLAGQGIGELRVFRRPKVAILNTGDELVPAGERLAPGKIYDSNSLFLSARLSAMGITPVPVESCPDDHQVMYAALRSLLADNDMVITTGGIASGKKDVVRAVAARLAIENSGRIIMDGNRIGQASRCLALVIGGKALLGLSGSPSAASATFDLIARPILNKIAGRGSYALRRIKGTALNEYGKSVPGRRYLVPARIEGGGVFLLPGGSPGNLEEYNCFANLSVSVDLVTPGSEVEVILL